MDSHVNGEMLNAYVDGLLLPSEKDEVEGHLVECGHCSQLVTALQEEAESLMAALGAPGVTRTAQKGWTGRQWVTTLVRVAAVAIIVFATSLATIWLDRVTKPSQAVEPSVVKAAPARETPRLTVSVREAPRQWRVVPASFVVPSGRDETGAGDEIEL